MTKQQTTISKTISYALRHRPEKFGLKLDKDGWVSVEELLASVSHELHMDVGRKDVEDIVALSDKKRFVFDGDRIRATYGHSFDNKIEFKATEPPRELYHGTSERAWKSIESNGLKPMNRQYVHLSSDFDTAKTVGMRHDGHEVYVIFVDAAEMYKDGFKFYHSANDGTWMCESVPPKYFKHRVLVSIP